jgi:alpha-glucoside transport system substrate-binding protein
MEPRIVKPDEHCWEAALDGDLTPEVSAHLAGCAECAALVEHVQNAAVAMQAEIPPPPLGLDVRVLASLERERQKRSRFTLPRLRLRLPIRPLALAAGVAALLVAGLVLVQPSKLVSHNAVAVQPWTTQCSGGGRLVVGGVWAGQEASDFARVLGRFQERTGIQVLYVYETHDIVTHLRSALRAGCTPDVVLLPQPGTMADFARHHELKPLAPVAGDLVARNYSPAWQSLGTVDGQLYGVWFKGASKSMIWYRPQALARAGISSPPQTWTELIADAVKLRAAGIQPFAVAGATAWTLTDWFENVYLATAGPVRYQELAQGQLKWTDPSVRHALSLLGELFGNSSLTGGASQTSLAKSVAEVFGPHPTAAMVYEGDFVSSFLPSTLRRSDARFFPFPGLDSTSEVGGDVAVLFSNSRAAHELIRFLATPAAAEPWAGAGGFISPNRAVPLSDYRDPLTRRLAERLVGAGTIRFDLSDQLPPAFGSTDGQGMWLTLQQFLADPSQIDRVTSELQSEASAARACEQAVRGQC